MVEASFNYNVRSSNSPSVFFAYQVTRLAQPQVNAMIQLPPSCDFFFFGTFHFSLREVKLRPFLSHYSIFIMSISRVKVNGRVRIGGCVSISVTFSK